MPPFPYSGIGIILQRRQEGESARTANPVYTTAFFGVWKGVSCGVRKDNDREGGSPSRPRRAEKGISCLGSLTVELPHSLYRVFLEAAGVVIPPYVACPAAEIGVAGTAADPEVAEPVLVFLVAVADVVSEVAEPVVVFLVVVADVVSEIAEPVVVFLVVVADVVSGVAEPVVVFVSVASVVYVSEPQAFVDIALVFDVLVPVFVVAVEDDSSGLPRFFAFPNIDCYSRSSSSVEVSGEGFVHSSTGVRSNYGLCNMLSSRGLHRNKILEHCYNKPSPGYNSASDTNDLPMDATTNHSRKTHPHPHLEQRTRSPYQASLSQPEVAQIRSVVAEKFQYLCLPLPLSDLERQLPTPAQRTNPFSASISSQIPPYPACQSRRIVVTPVLVAVVASTG